MLKKIGGRRTLKKSVPTRACALEKDIERGILHYLSFIPSVMVWKQNTVGVFDHKTGRYRLPHSPYIIRGISDIIGVVNFGLVNGQNYGRFLAIECKTPHRKNNLSEDQKEFIDSIKRFGGIAFVATSIEDVKKIFLEEGLITSF